MTPQPIPTKYNGYHFRSRTEARWAVFFDALGIRYEYEKEGFKLPSGYYLPDFWLPDQEFWVEVKPTLLYEGDEEKCVELATQTERSVLLFQGTPGDEEVKCFSYDGDTVAYSMRKVFYGVISEGGIKAGYREARSARFEFGETPKAVRLRPAETTALCAWIDYVVAGSQLGTDRAVLEAAVAIGSKGNACCMYSDYRTPANYHKPRDFDETKYNSIDTRCPIELAEPLANISMACVVVVFYSGQPEDDPMVSFVESVCRIAKKKYCLVSCESLSGRDAALEIVEFLDRHFPENFIGVAFIGPNDKERKGIYDFVFGVVTEVVNRRKGPDWNKPDIS